MDLHTANQIGRLDQCFLSKDHHTVETILGIVLIIVHHTKALDLEILIVNSGTAKALWRSISLDLITINRSNISSHNQECHIQQEITSSNQGNR
jgi:hypothetical protein